jgi:class 3 adenylate cyclase/tetratricopeptide (TPR) repeat protein
MSSDDAFGPADSGSAQSSQPKFFARSSAATFVGRSHESEELIAGFAPTLQGHGQVFLICGEPGIGKTRIADEISDIARARGMRVLWGRCWEAGDSPPYWPWKEVLRECIGDRAPDSALDPVAILSIARHAEGFPQPGEGVRASIAPEESDLGRFALYEAATRLLKRTAESSPLLIVLDDLHAADAASLQLLRFVAHSLRGSSILLIGTYRDVEIKTSPQLSAILAEISRDARTIKLRGLGRKDVGEFVRASGGRGLGEEALEVLYRTTGGNPFFLNETLRLVLAEQNLNSISPESIKKIVIPDTVRAAIRRRIELVPPAVQDALRIGAAIGVEFDFALLQRITELAPAPLLYLVGQGIAAELLREQAPRGSYRFAHSLTAETIYQDLDPSERLKLHQKIASAMESLYEANLGPHLAEIARHYASAHEAGGGAKTIDYLRRAARQAMDSLAYEEAVRLLQTALRIAESSGLATLELQYDLLMEASEALSASGLVSQARQAFEEASRLARKLGDGDKIARAALGRAGTPSENEVDQTLVGVLDDALSEGGPEDIRTRAKMLARLGSELKWSRDPRAHSATAEALELANRSGDAITRIYVFYWGSVATWSVDNLEERISNLTEAVDLAESIGNKLWILKTRHMRFLSLLESSDMLRADADLGRFAELTDELRLPFGWKQMAFAERALMDGRLDDAEKFAFQSLEIGRRLERRFRTVRQTFNNLSLILRREQGRISEVEPIYRAAVARRPSHVLANCALAFCRAEMNQHREAALVFDYITSNHLESIPHVNIWYAVMVLLSEVCVYLDDAPRAETLYKMMAPYADRNALLDLHVCYGPVARYLGALATVGSHFDDAERHFEAAIESNRRMGARLWLAHSLFDYASMLLRRGNGDDRARALGYLDTAIKDATASGLKALGDKALALRASLAVLPTVTPAPETPRSAETDGSRILSKEGEVWRLEWAGKTSRLKDSKGLGYIAHLLRYPGQEFHVLDLVAPGSSASEQFGEFAGGETEELSQSRTRHFDEAYRQNAFGDAGEMLDARAKASYKKRLAELREEIAEARRLGQDKRAQKAEDESEAITKELARAVGLSGRDRRAAAVTERARVNIARAIKATIQRIARSNPSMGRHLAKSIRTGTFCEYIPDVSRSDGATRDTHATADATPSSSIDAVVAAAVAEPPGDLSAHAAPDGTATILFTDMESSSVLFERLGDLRAQEILRAHNAIVREQVALHKGYEVKSMGDGFMIAFSGARRALLCAIAIQRAFTSYCQQNTATPIRVRIGLHVGETINESADFFGKAVILAARIAALAHGGEIMVSATLRDLTESAGDLRFSEVGEVQLKGLAGTHRIYKAIW